jgi:release factor glutamine methyltransferase
MMELKVYMPREDSYLLEREVLKNASGSVLDMGTGSGIQARAAASSPDVKRVLAVDINPHAINFCRDHLKGRKIKLLLSNLFSKIPKQKFDTIIFNPPYLPKDKVEDPAVDGGVKGHEILEKFLNQVNDYLSPEGIILIVFSSLTNQDKVNELLMGNMLKYELLSTAHFVFEDLFVYRIEKLPVLKDLNKKKVSEVKYLAHGKRGIVYTGKYRGMKVAIKTKHPDSTAMNSVENESNMLKLLNRYKIGPKFYFRGDNYLVYEFIEGEFIKDWLPKAKKPSIKKVLKTVLLQCHKMDSLSINKEEMHHPVKHIIIGKKIVMIDFERAHKTIDPKNVTQFCNYIMLNQPLLEGKGICFSREKMIDLLKCYKNKHLKLSLRDFHKIMKEIGLS